MSKKIRFGIVGCGMIANMHADAIASIDGAELVGVTDNFSEAAKAFAEKRGVRAYSDYAEMLGDEAVDAVCICTPSYLHAEMSIAAMNAGKHVVVEKPMALDVSEADEVISTSEKTGKLLSVVYQLRFEEDVLRLKGLVDSGAFGRITLCNLSLNYYRSKEYFASSNWKGKLKYDGGGALMNQGIHGVDLMEYIVGNVKGVRGKIATLIHDIEVEDTAVATVEFESGALGVITASTCAYPGFGRTLEIYGESGYAILTENTLSKLMLNGKEVSLDEKDAIGCASDPTALSYEMHRRQLTNFIDAIRGRAELVSDARAGKCAVRLIKEIYKG
jgi:predicted dehydrogenase